MRLPRGIRRALHLRLTKQHVEHEIDDELTFHIEQRTAQLIAAGAAPKHARAEAVRRFGDRTAHREQCVAEDVPTFRREGLMTFIDDVATDARRSVRSLRRSPWYSLVAISTLGVGIAAVTAIFSFVYSFYWRPLPFPNADRTLSVVERRTNALCCTGVTMDAAKHIAASVHSFDRVTRYDVVFGDLATGNQARQLSTLLVDSAFYDVLGLHAQIGHLPSPEEIRANLPVVAISDELWRSVFGGDERVVGRRIQIGTEQLRIVGVLPPRFGFPRRTDALRPLPPSNADDSLASTGLLGRLKPGATRRQADAELTTIARRMHDDAGARSTRISFTIQAEMLDRRANQAMPMPSLFIGAAIFLLLVACSNVGNLVLVRAAERRSEMAVRAALGASRWRLIGQTLTESLVLSAAAGVVGVIGAVSLVKVGLLLIPTQGFPLWVRFGLDARILAVTTAVVALATIAVGLTPALEGTRFDLARAIKAGGDGGSLSATVARRGRRGLAGQLALSIVLFIGAGLFLQSYRAVTHADLGYPADHLASVMMFFDPNRYAKLPARVRVAESLAEALRSNRGIVGTAIRGTSGNRLIEASAVPVNKRHAAERPDFRVIPDGDTTRAISESRLPARMRQFVVSEYYFATARLRVLQGRGIERTDVVGATPVAVVSERFASTFWPHANALGHQFREGAKGPDFTVVGVVQDVRDLYGGRVGYSADPHPDVYLSYRQVETYYPEVIAYTTGSSSAAGILSAAALHSIDPQLLSRTDPLGGSDEARFVMKIFGSVIGTFGVAGLLLSIIGLYGVIAYTVAQRRREIGVRLALGATPRLVSWEIVRDAMRFVAVGILAGLVAAAIMSRLLLVFLFRVSPLDGPTYAVAAVLFALVAIAGCWVPGRRAARVDPMLALRAE